MESEKVFFPPQKWYESESNVLTMDELLSFKKELERLNQEDKEDDFLLGKAPTKLTGLYE